MVNHLQNRHEQCLTYLIPLIIVRHFPFSSFSRSHFREPTSDPPTFMQKIGDCGGRISVRVLVPQRTNG
jgi:hypothetical protein